MSVMVLARLRSGGSPPAHGVTGEQEQTVLSTINGFNIIAAMPRLPGSQTGDAASLMIVGVRPQTGEHVTAWVTAVTDREWWHGNYFPVRDGAGLAEHAATRAAALRDAARRAGYLDDAA